MGGAGPVHDREAREILRHVDERAAEELFRHKVLGLLRRRGLLSDERIELLLSWRRSGFSVHNRVFAHPRDGREFEGRGVPMQLGGRLLRRNDLVVVD